MDPNVVYADFRYARALEKWEEAYDAAQLLASWLVSGGFIPEEMARRYPTMDRGELITWLRSIEY